MRKTKIICTLGPATDKDEVLRQLMLEGMNVARLNFSHQTAAEQKVRADTVKKLRDELRLPVILTIENSDGRIAEAVKSNTTKKNQKILAMNSLQSVTKEQIADGITYLQVMQENLSVLSEALN